MEAYEREHLAVVRELAPECVVLLKSKGDFPLSEASDIALYGNGARHTVKGGTGSGEVNSRFTVTIEQGLENAGFRITSKAWLNAYDEMFSDARKEFLDGIKKEAKAAHTLPVMIAMGRVMPEPDYDIPMKYEADCAIYVLSRNSGEGSDRLACEGDILLSRTEIRDILEAHKKYKHFMLVLNVGGPVDLTPVMEVENIMLLSQLGAVTGDVFADILLGRSIPSGKLTTTWTAWEDYPTIGDYIQPDEVCYREGIYVGYRWFDSVGKRPAFPFGYGLGFTEFEVGKALASLEGSVVTVKVPVRNTGGYAGKEVVQVYVSVPWGRMDHPYQMLAGWSKTSMLRPGESEEVTIRFNMTDLACWDNGNSVLMLEQGCYIVRTGTDSGSTTVTAAVRLTEEVILRELTHVGGTPDFDDWKPEKIEHIIPKGAPVLKLDKSSFDSIRWPEPHESSEYARGFAASLDDERLLKLCIGRFSKGFTFASVIGASAQSVAGATGETSDAVKALRPLAMADGPAGLRLSTHYFRDKKGVHPVGTSLPDDFVELIGPVVMKFMNAASPKPRGKIYEQYCTAIPVGTALAQSWNLEIPEACGDLVGDEMERTGISLWLAPAFNIHRTIRCGRNFEYYSEDPLLSGMMGAAVTRGVQKHPGCGTTVKHFCCNNQELNRNTSSSNLSERTLREMYLRPFEICLRESDPAALMTSYNLINGVHSMERKDLVQTVLREEWGWGGLVMTDWVISSVAEKGRYRCAHPAPTIANANLFMPGGPKDFKQAMAALRGRDPEFKLSREEAENCAAQVIDTVIRLGGRKHR